MQLFVFTRMRFINLQAVSQMVSLCRLRAYMDAKASLATVAPYGAARRGPSAVLTMYIGCAPRLPVQAILERKKKHDWKSTESHDGLPTRTGRSRARRGLQAVGGSKLHDANASASTHMQKG